MTFHMMANVTRTPDQSTAVYGTRTTRCVST